MAVQLDVAMVTTEAARGSIVDAAAANPIFEKFERPNALFGALPADVPKNERLLSLVQAVQRNAPLWALADKGPRVYTTAVTSSLTDWRFPQAEASFRERLTLDMYDTFVFVYQYGSRNFAAAVVYRTHTDYGVSDTHYVTIRQVGAVSSRTGGWTMDNMFSEFAKRRFGVERDNIQFAQNTSGTLETGENLAGTVDNICKFVSIFARAAVVPNRYTLAGVGMNDENPLAIRIGADDSAMAVTPYTVLRAEHLLKAGVLVPEGNFFGNVGKFDTPIVPTYVPIVPQVARISDATRLFLRDNTKAAPVYTIVGALAETVGEDVAKETVSSVEIADDF